VLILKCLVSTCSTNTSHAHRVYIRPTTKLTQGPVNKLAEEHPTGTQIRRKAMTMSQPMCQSIAGPPVDEAIGMLIAEQMTPAAVELALEVRKEIQARHEEADRLRCCAIERAQTEAELAQRRFMLVDPGNRLVADTLEGEWNEELRTLASARERGREHDQFILDKAVHERLVAMTDPDTPSRGRKRLMAHIIENVTLLKLPADGTTKFHVRFKGGKISRRSPL